MTFWIINTIIAAYIISTIAFLLLMLFFKSFRRRTNTFLNKANLIIIFVLLLNIIWVGQGTIECYVESRKGIGINISTAYRQNCFLRLIWTFLFAFIFQTTFFLNRNRPKISLTIISVLLLTVPYNYERIVIFITNLYRDYSPSSWSVYYDNSNIYWTIIVTIIYFIVCFTNNKKKPFKIVT
jgi:hypothetical protein